MTRAVAKGWKMGEYPMTLPKPRTAEEALVELESFNHGASVKILRARIEELEAMEKRTRNFVESMKTWASPYGISMEYSNRILNEMDGTGNDWMPGDGTGMFDRREKEDND